MAKCSKKIQEVKYINMFKRYSVICPNCGLVYHLKVPIFKRWDGGELRCDCKRIIIFVNKMRLKPLKKRRKNKKC